MVSTAQSAVAAWWAARERCCSRGRWYRSSSDPPNFINEGEAPTKLDLLCFVFRLIFIFFSTEPEVTSPGSPLWQSTHSLLRKVIFITPCRFSTSEPGRCSLCSSILQGTVTAQPWFCWTVLAPVQSLGNLCYALQNTGYLLELQVEWNHLEFGVLPTAIALTVLRPI